MKALTKKLWSAVVAFAMAFTFIFSGMSGIFTAISAKAEATALETEFTNNGQFAVDYYTGSTAYPYEFVDGAGEGLPAGYNGAVVKVASKATGGAPYINVDFTASKISASMVESVVARVYSPDYTTADELRINNTTGSLGGAGAYDLSTWCDVELPLATITGADGNLGSFAFGLRDKGTVSDYFYIDSITVNMARDMEAEFTNGQFTLANYSGDATNFPYEIIDGASTTLPAGYDGLVAKIGSVINGGAAYINIDFTASQIPASKVESVVARVYSPDYTADDQLRINGVSGSVGTYDLSTWCDVVLPLSTITGTDGNLGSFAFGLRDKGTISDYFYIDSITVNMVKPVVTVPVTFTHINSSWNNNTETLGNGMYYTILHLDGVLSSGYYTQGDDWSEMMANATINGGASYFSFCPASFIAGPNVNANFIVMYTAQAPTAGEKFFIPAGTTFKVGGDDTNVYEIKNDISFVFNGTAWEVYVPSTEPVSVTFTNINASWNNNSETLGNGMYYTLLHIDGLMSSGYYTQGDDWSDMTAKATINGGESYFSFCPASFIAGPNVEANYIVMYSDIAPTAGDEFFVPAGTTFKVGGNDTNVYKLSADISLKFNGTAWVEPVKASYYVYECVDPEILHTYTTTQNADGSFTYTLPEYEREGKVLLGYVMNYIENDAAAQTFIPSGEYTTTVTVTAFIALWGEFTTVDGASIRIASAETSGIRWTTTIDAEGYNNIAYWATSFEFGTELSADGFSENFDIVAKVWRAEISETVSVAEYTGVLIDINSKYYTTEFTARGYVDITYHNGETKRIYAVANDTTRSIQQVATLALADETAGFTNAEKTILRKIAGQ